MRHLKKAMWVVWAMILVCGLPAPVIYAADSIPFMSVICGDQASRKIVLFRSNVSLAQQSRFVADWLGYDVFPLMPLPIVNGALFCVPDTVNTEDLALDSRVAGVEDDGKVQLSANVVAAGEGGAGEGGATVFITPAEGIAANYRPRGVLSVLEHPYNPFLIADSYQDQAVPPLVAEALYDLKKVKNLKIAVFDTGIDIKHPYFNNVDAVRGGIDLVNMIPGIPLDDNGHGTHVAGTFCGRFLGIARDAQLYVVKVLDQNATGDISAVIMGLQWAIEQKIRIVNMSFAFRSDHPALHLAIQQAYQAGIVMIAAAGNHSNWLDDGATGEGGAGEGGAGEGGAGEGGASGDGDFTNPYPVMYPAAYPEVIAVGAHDPFGATASFSNTGPEVIVTAPGTDVFSANINKGFGLCNGTSMATPHVSGTVALMLALAQTERKSVTPAEVKTILKQTAEFGRLNTYDALWAIKMHP